MRIRALQNDLNSSMSLSETLCVRHTKEIHAPHPKQVHDKGQIGQPQISAKLLEELIPGPVTKEEFKDIFQNFKKAFIERALNAEMSHHLGYTSTQVKPEGTTNHRNGSSPKTVLTDTGSLRIDVPREREGSFEPQLIGKHERRLAGFDDLDLPCMPVA